jgi:ketosteroid isomerase-like protein
MSDQATPTDVVMRLLSGISEARWHDLADLYAPDAVVEQPLMAPHRGRVAGREQVRAHFAAAAAGPLRLRAFNVGVHTTGDPEVIVAEFDYEVHHATTGRTITAANVQVLRVRDGQIVQTRDYHDHLRLAAVAGRAGALAEALAASA